jgi:hypothetical protein
MNHLRAPVLLLLASGGCSSSSSSTLPTDAQIHAFTRVSNVLLVQVDVAGTTGLLGVDTGDPYVLLNPMPFSSAPSVGSVSTLTVESDNLRNVPVITSSQSPTGPDPSVPLGGLLGCTVLCNSVVSFNYRDTVFTIGSSAAPSGLMPEIKTPFSLKGGGKVQVNGTSVTLPKSRIVVNVDIEGSKHTLLVDTGATDVILAQALYSAITKDGRTQLSGGTVDTTSGMSTASFTRVKTISLGGTTANGVVVAHDVSFDTNLADVSSDAGETIEGSLGGTFLQNYFVTIDYPGGELHLARYTDTSFILDPGQIVGFAVAGSSSGGYVVGKVFAGTDAASKGVTVGDDLVAIAGQTLSGMSPSEVSVLLGGKVGSTKTVQFGSAQTLGNQTVTLKVDELLPLP